FFSSRRRHTRSKRDWSSDVCSSDLNRPERWRTCSTIAPVYWAFPASAATRGCSFEAKRRLQAKRWISSPFASREKPRRSPRRLEIGRASWRERGKLWGGGGP